MSAKKAGKPRRTKPLIAVDPAVAGSEVLCSVPQSLRDHLSPKFVESFDQVSKRKSVTHQETVDYFNPQNVQAMASADEKTTPKETTL